MYSRSAACVASYTVNVVPIYIYMYMRIHITQDFDCEGVEEQYIVLGTYVL